MLRALGVSTVIAFLFVSAPASAQVADSWISAEDAVASVGKPLVSSDGETLGRVQGIVAETGVVVLLAEIDRQMGLGAQIVTIDSAFVARVGDRVELNVTAGDIRERLRETDSLSDAETEREQEGKDQ